jgi:hypothetical protein
VNFVFAHLARRRHLNSKSTCLGYIFLTFSLVHILIYQGMEQKSQMQTIPCFPAAHKQQQQQQQQNKAKTMPKQCQNVA